MASARKTRPVRGNGRGDSSRVTYAEFMRDLLDGTITATALHDVTEADGEDEVRVPQFDERGEPLPPIVLTVPRRRLVAVEYTERPAGASGSPPNDRGDRENPNGSSNRPRQ